MTKPSQGLITGKCLFSPHSPTCVYPSLRTHKTYSYSSGNGDALLHRGQIKLTQDDIRGAITDLRRAIAIDDSPVSHNTRPFHIHTVTTSRSSQTHTYTLTYTHKPPVAYACLGTALFKAEETGTRAEETLREASEKHPRSLEVGVCVCVCARACVCACVCVCLRIISSFYIHRHIYTYKYTHTHTHTIRSCSIMVMFLDSEGTLRGRWRGSNRLPRWTHSVRSLT